MNLQYDAEALTKAFAVAGAALSVQSLWEKGYVSVNLNPGEKTNE